jgi:hypothetical protein
LVKGFLLLRLLRGGKVQEPHQGLAAISPSINSPTLCTPPSSESETSTTHSSIPTKVFTVKLAAHPPSIDTPLQENHQTAAFAAPIVTKDWQRTGLLLSQKEPAEQVLLDPLFHFDHGSERILQHLYFKSSHRSTTKRSLSAITPAGLNKTTHIFIHQLSSQLAI